MTKHALILNHNVILFLLQIYYIGIKQYCSSIFCGKQYE